MKYRQEIATYNKISPLDDIKIEPFDVNKRFTKPHKHNKYIEIVYFIEGSGSHYLDIKPYSIEPLTVFIIKKDEVHHWEITTEPKGYVIIIKESFLEKTLDKFIHGQLIKLHYTQKIDISPEDQSLNAFFKALTWEMKQKVPNQEVVEGGLKAILSKLVNYSATSGSKNTDRAAQFINLLSENLKNKVSFYADALHTSPQNLNSTCHRVFHKKASEVIAEHIIKEVKRKLVYTTKQVNEIAYDMGFKDSSHFTKYFKRHTQQTPLQFKKSKK